MHLRFNLLLLNQTLNTIKWINIVVKLKVDQLFNKISLWIIVLKIKNAFNYKTFIDIIINLFVDYYYSSNDMKLCGPTAPISDFIVKAAFRIGDEYRPSVTSNSKVEPNERNWPFVLFICGQNTYLSKIAKLMDRCFRSALAQIN
jgi:hypothetical protein